MTDELRDDLTSIDGVGTATTDKILAVLDDHEMAGESRLLEKARDAAERGDDREAAVYLRRDA